MTPPLAVVLGSSGRLGRHLLPALAAAGFDTVGVSRRPAANTMSDLAYSPASASSVRQEYPADLRRAADVTALSTLVLDHAAQRSRVVVVDAVLDRTGVKPMRESLNAAVAAGALIDRRLAAVGIPTAGIVASTTAALAPRLYQTPYGIAKRQQLVAYARSGLSGAAILLPMLADQPVDVSAGQHGWPTWSFDHAAARITERATAVPERPFTVHLPDLTCGLPGLSTSEGRGHMVVNQPLGFWTDGLRSHLRSLLTHRGSMADHRAAARARLLITPATIRASVDHHRASPRLARRFTDRHNLVLTLERPAAERRCRPEPAGIELGQDGP